jgi:pimeloyl-ACP methyl ester carboxylesterase
MHGSWLPLALALAVVSAGATAAPCVDPDNVTRVTGNGECLVLRTYRSPGLTTAPALVVGLHGDMSGGGTPDYIFRVAQRIATQWGLVNVVAVGLVRPGYSESGGAQSTGDNHDRMDSYTARNIDAVAAAVARLKAHHRAGRAILLGHSGGAAIAAVALGRHPGLAAGAVLVACPCDIDKWLASGNRRPWTRSVSPRDYAGRVPPATRVIAINGRNDEVTPRS